MPEAKIIHIGGRKPKRSEPCPEGMVDSRKFREVPVGGPSHMMLEMAAAAIAGLPLDTIRHVEMFKAHFRHLMIELNRETMIGMPAVFDTAQDVIKEISQEMQP